MTPRQRTIAQSVVVVPVAGRANGSAARKARTLPATSAGWVASASRSRVPRQRSPTIGACQVTPRGSADPPRPGDPAGGGNGAPAEGIGRRVERLVVAEEEREEAGRERQHE